MTCPAIRWLALWRSRRSRRQGRPAARTASLSAAPSLPPALAKALDPVIDALWSRGSISRPRMDHVRVRRRSTGGCRATPATTRRSIACTRDSSRPASRSHRDRRHRGPEVFVEEYPNSGHGWDHSIGTLALVRAGQPDEVVLSKAKERIALCINSFSTAPGRRDRAARRRRPRRSGRGLRRQGRERRRRRSAMPTPAQLWRRARHGATARLASSPARSASTSIPIRRARSRRRARRGTSCSGAASRTTRRRKASASRRRRARRRRCGSALRRPARRDRARHDREHVLDQARAHARRRDSRPRRCRPSASCIAAHVQEPGANDNASGVATLAEVARALSHGIQQEQDSAARPHADVSLARRDQRQPAMAAGATPTRRRT